MSNLFENNGALFSPCKKYRYRLWRIWDETKPLVMCIGLNPSTANGEKNDPTITNLIKAFKKINYGGFYMMNLFAFVSSKPASLLLCPDPLGENDVHLNAVKNICSEVVFCWGTFPEATQRIKHVELNFLNAKCFGKNANGTPEHPLFSLVYKQNKPPLQLINYF